MPRSRSVKNWFAILIVWVVAIPAAALAQEDTSAKLQILNDSDMEVSVVWRAAEGKTKEVSTVPPHQKRLVRTFVGHVHMLQNPDGETLATVRCQQRVQAFRFERPGQKRLSEVGPTVPANTVIPTTEEMNLPAYYDKIIFANGYPICGSPQVSRYALLEAAYLSNQLLDQHPEVRQAMIESGSRLCIMSEDEFTTDLPEFQWLAKNSPMKGISGKDFWDARARGLGGSDTDPYCSCGEENLLSFPGDPYSTENILIHEFAHNIHLRGKANVDPTFDKRVRQAYQSAMQAGLWKGKYASVNHHEYFAEGVQSWFNNNRENDHDHNHVNTRAELLEYDPGLAELCREVFGETQFRYTKVQQRPTDHMEGYQEDPETRFRWPKRLQAAKKAILEDARARSKKAEE